MHMGMKNGACTKDGSWGLGCGEEQAKLRYAFIKAFAPRCGEKLPLAQYLSVKKEKKNPIKYLKPKYHLYISDCNLSL